MKPKYVKSGSSADGETTWIVYAVWFSDSVQFRLCINTHKKALYDEFHQTMAGVDNVIGQYK